MDGTARLWQVESGELKREFQHSVKAGGDNGTNEVSVNSVAIADMDTHSNNGNHYIVTGSSDTTARVWDRLRGR
jgi:WD40 repeat protein